MKALITGAAGFIGSNLAKKLLKEGHEVFGIDNFITGTKENIVTLAKGPKFNFLEADISRLSFSQIESLKRENFEEIYDLACPTGVPNLVTLAEEMLQTCSEGTKNILEIAKDSQSRFLLTSSSEIYGDPQEKPQREDYTGNVDPVGLRSPYEEGKRFAESLTMMYQRKFGINTKIVRIFNTYGPDMNMKDERVIPKFLNQAREGKKLSVHGKGEQKRTFCYVDDLTEGLIKVMRKGLSGEGYNIGSDQEISILELAELIKKTLRGKNEIVFAPRPSHDHEERLPDLKKIAALGWKPNTPLSEGLKKTISSYQFLTALLD